MILETAIILLIATVAGIVLVALLLRKKPKLRIVCLVLLSLIAMLLVGYIGVTLFFIDAVRNQPADF
ncbi:MAG: hypothetical protein ACI4JY_10905 [Oscillospiraceae bacterium]